MASRLSAFIVWAVVAASVVFWAMRLLASGAPVPAHATLAAEAASGSGDWSRLLGARVSEPAALPVAPPAASSLKLVGVVAPRNPSTRHGLALIAVEDKPARAFRVGSRVDGELVLLSVTRRGASLGPPGGAATVTLELPALPAPARGTPGVPALGSTPLPGPALTLPPPEADHHEAPQEGQPPPPILPPIQVPQRAGN